MPLPTHFPPVLPIIAGKRTLSENARMHFTVQQVHTYYSMAYLHSVFFWSYTLVPWCKSSSFTPQTLNGLRIFGWVSYSDLPKRSYPNHPLTFYAEPVGRTGSCSCRSGVLRGEVCVEVSLVFRLELSNSFYSRGCIRRCGLLDWGRECTRNNSSILPTPLILSPRHISNANGDCMQRFSTHVYPLFFVPGRGRPTRWFGSAGGWSLPASAHPPVVLRSLRGSSTCHVAVQVSEEFLCFPSNFNLNVIKTFLGTLFARGYILNTVAWGVMETRSLWRDTLPCSNSHTRHLRMVELTMLQPFLRGHTGIG